MKSIADYWYRGHPLLWLLLPLTLVFCLLRNCRRLAYRLGWLSSFGVDVPVVVVGNITVGGSGKTPLVIALCEQLQARGERPGVVSRGYGGRLTETGRDVVHQLGRQDSPMAVGDEPWMIFQRTGCPVVVGRDRAAAVEHLLANNDCTVVVSDDGLQHYRMRRNLEIVVVDAGRLLGNGLCLPAGPLRESVDRLSSVDLVVYNGRVTQPLAMTDADACYTLEPMPLVNLQSGEERPLPSFAGSKVLAVAGIGHPQRFFDLLERHGIEVDACACRDHHDFRDDEIRRWARKTVIMTEKDAVKCRSRVRAMQTGFDEIWYLPVKAVFSPSLAARLQSLWKPLFHHE